MCFYLNGIEINEWPWQYTKGADHFLKNPLACQMCCNMSMAKNYSNVKIAAARLRSYNGSHVYYFKNIYYSNVFFFSFLYFHVPWMIIGQLVCYKQVCLFASNKNKQNNVCFALFLFCFCFWIINVILGFGKQRKIFCLSSFARQKM